MKNSVGEKTCLLILSVLLVVGFFIVPVNAQTLAQRLAGYILLQVQSVGEAWYVNPSDGLRYYLRDGSAAYEMMRTFSLGISDGDLSQIPYQSSAESVRNSGSICSESPLADRLKGKILLQVEDHGKAWYVDPQTCRRVYMKNGEQAYSVMKYLGLGISNDNLNLIPAATGLQPVVKLKDSTSGITNSTDEWNTKARRDILQAINSERASRGIKAVSLSNNLTQAAQYHADDMSEYNYLDFNTVSGTSVSQSVENYGYRAYLLAINMSQTNSDPSDIVRFWKNRYGVYSNSINNAYEEIGVGIGTVDGQSVYLVVFAQSYAKFFNEQTAGLNDLNDIYSQMLIALNEERSKHELPAMTLNNQLTQAAQGHANDMFARSYYNHATPEGVRANQRVALTGYLALISAENIAKGQFSVDEVMTGWMGSPGHRSNILDPELTEVGFGFAKGLNDEGYVTLWVQNFGTPF